MAKVTSKLQVTLPKALAEQYQIRPGADIEWAAAGDCIRVYPARSRPPDDRLARLEVFDAVTERQRAREKDRSGRPKRAGRGRGWSREELYERRPGGH